MLHNQLGTYFDVEPNHSSKTALLIVKYSQVYQASRIAKLNKHGSMLSRELSQEIISNRRQTNRRQGNQINK